MLSKDGAFTPLLENILMQFWKVSAHLTDEKRQTGNRRNDKMRKQVQAPLGEATVSIPCDRNPGFEPQFIKKRETIPAKGIANRITNLYAKE